MNALHPAPVIIFDARASTWRYARFFGAGSLIFAAFWCFESWRLFTDVGTTTFIMAMNEIITTGVDVQQTQHPVPPPRAEPTNPLDALQWKSPAAKSPAARPVSPLSPPRQPSKFAPDVAEATRQTWAICMSLLAGVIGVCGVSALLNSAAARRAAAVGIWVALLATAGGIGLWQWRLHWPGQDTISHLMRISQSKHVWSAFVGLILLAAAIVGVGALGRERQAFTWAKYCIAAVFLGTFISLAGLGILIGRAGLPPLPSWQYAALALVQSSWGWVVLMLPKSVNEGSA